MTMRELAWPIAALLIALFAFPVLVGPALRDASRAEEDVCDDAGAIEEEYGEPVLMTVRQALPAILGAFFIPLLLAMASRGLFGWRCPAGLGVATQASLSVAAVAMLLFFSAAFWSLTCEEPPAPAKLAGSISYFLMQPLYCVAAGALLFESLRLRASRREGTVAAPVMSDGLLLVLVPLAGLGLLLGVVRFH
ncbi:hypothetical protein ACFL59_03955 [Planctomycetota bacterium]